MADHKITEADKMDHEEVILPGFRFHPTDEELVGFYLKKKIEHRVLPIELIKQVDIYKYDPWDLPNLASSGEKEWYFYCPRDRKYKNSARPNRVTGAGFWKATGTDRPIYSSSNNDAKCIGLKKSLVFYRGRAAKGIKTDWMMHEFRLPPSLADQPESNTRIQDIKFSPNDAWAICRIFKKTNTIAQRAISHSWASSQIRTNSNQFSHENISCMSTTDHHLSYMIKPTSMINSTFSGLDHTLSYQPVNQILCKPSPFTLPYIDTTNRFMFPSTDNLELRVFENVNKTCEGIGFEGEHQPLDHTFMMNHYRENELGNARTTGVPSSFPTSAVADEWKLNMAWDSPPCPSESTTYSTNKCHT